MRKQHGKRDRQKESTYNACLGIATYLGLQNHDTLAGAIIAIAAVLSSIFYLKKNPQQKENSK